MFYVVCEAESKDAFYITDDDGAPQTYSTEADAITAAKDYSGVTLIMKAVARVTDRTTHKVEKIK